MNRQHVNEPRFKFLRPPDIAENEKLRKSSDERELTEKLRKCEFVFLEKKSGLQDEVPSKRRSYLYELNPVMRARRRFPAITEEKSDKEIKKFGKSKSFSQKSHKQKTPTKDVRKKSVAFKTRPKSRAKEIKTIDAEIPEKKPEKRALSPQKEPATKFRKSSKESGIPIMKKISLINEILKDHAQKPLTDSKSCHEINLEPRKLPEKRSVRKNLDEKPKAKGSASEPLKKSSPKRSISCPKKIEAPQSKELASKTIDMPKNEISVEQEKSPQRRITHTDQLIASKLKPQVKDEVLGKKMVTISEVIKVRPAPVKPEAIRKALEYVQSSQPSTANSYDSTLDSASLV